MATKTRIETADDLKAKVDDIVDAYFAAALWSSVNHDEYEEDAEIHFDQDYDPGDFPQKEWEKAQELVRDFIDKHPEDLVTFANAMTVCQIGYDLWLTRCGHGAGFWDRKMENRDLDQEMLDRLTKTCWEFGEVHVWSIAGTLCIE